MTPCLVVMAKLPRPGKVKTRIASVLGDDRAAEIYECALHDTLAVAASIPDVACILSYAPPTDEGRRYFEQAAPMFVLIPQQGATLGERLSATFAQLLQSYSQVVVIGSDSPDLPAAIIARAFNLLGAPADAVIGPAKDGGYYLVGLRAVQPSLFESIDWGTDAVLAQTRQRAEAAGLLIADLPLWHDLDTVDDLNAMVAPGAPLTREFVAAMNAKAKR